MILSAQWFCTETGAAIRIVMLPCPAQCPNSLCCEPKEDYLSEISWKGAHMAGGWICTLCNWRQTQGAPDILASREHWCTNCRKKRPSLWSQSSGPHFLQRLSPSWIFKQKSPRQQCWRSSGCGPMLSAIPPGWFDGLQDQLHWPVATPTTKTEKEQSWWQHDHQDVHPCASRAPSGSIFSSWRKYCPDYHHFYDALPHGDWILNTGTSSVLIPRQAPLDIKGRCSAV